MHWYSASCRSPFATRTERTQSTAFFHQAMSACFVVLLLANYGETVGNDELNGYARQLSEVCPAPIFDCTMFHEAPLVALHDETLDDASTLVAAGAASLLCAQVLAADDVCEVL